MSDDEQTTGQTPLQRYIEATDPAYREARLRVLGETGAEVQATDRPDSLTIGGTGKGQIQAKIYLDVSDPITAQRLVDNAIALAQYAAAQAAAAGVGQ